MEPRDDGGFGFDFAALIFAGEMMEQLGRSEIEPRVQAIGEADGVVISVIYTDRGTMRRIISARAARRKERKLWLAR